MTLRTRLVITSLAVAVPVAAALFEVTDWMRTRDMTTSLDRFVRQQIDGPGRQRCEMDPASFPGGSGRPPAPPSTDPNDVPPPRRSLIEHRPFELFAYDEEFHGQNVNAPRFPEDFRRKLLSSQPQTSLTGPFAAEEGSGVQMAVSTGWNGPCAVLFARMRPVPGQRGGQFILLTALCLTIFTVAMVAGTPTVRRIAQLTTAVRRSAHQEYGEVVSVKGRDEISSLAFAFNEAGADIRRRIVDVREREEALRRFVANTTQDVVLPLTVLQDHLTDLEKNTGLPAAARDAVKASIVEAHYMASLLQNLGATARLRSAEATTRVPVDMNALVERVMARHRSVARAAQVELKVAVPDPPIVAPGDVTFFEAAVNNLVDNAIQYNAPGGHVAVVLDRVDRGERFFVRVTDDGPGVASEDLKRLAIRRFRTDEARTRRPGGLGLGLEIVRDVAAKFDLQINFRRPPAGGFEAELSGKV